MIDVVIGIALAAAGVALGAFSIDLYATGARTRAWNVVRVLMVAAGVAIAAGVVPVTRTRGAATVAWRDDVEAALADARGRGVPAVLDAGADWCGACKELEHRTFADPDVAAALAGFVAVRIDMTRFDEAQARLERIGVKVPALPWVGFFLPDGRLNPGVTLTDFEPPSQFLNRIAEAGTYRAAPLTPVEAWLGERGLLVALLLVFVAGIGVSLTPCVYPMIPITISVVGGVRGSAEAASMTGGRRVVRSGAFVAGLLVTYVSLGVVSALLGKGFGSWLQHPGVTIGMAVLFAALAASYLGFFSLDLPASWKARIGRRRGGLAGVAAVGMGTGLLAAPCAGPVVVGILALISGTGDLGLGVLLMVAFASGLSLLFFVLGLSTAFLARLPRGGAWMERVEVAFAVALLVVASYYFRLGATAIFGP
jgi:thiol:disulfide interchange protein